MTLQQNSFEGGTNGTVVTTSNSGGASGDPLYLVVGSPTFSSAQAAHGALSVLLDSNSTQMRYAVSGTESTLSVRWYGYNTNQPTGDDWQIRLLSSSSATILTVMLKSTGTLALDRVGTRLFTSSAAVPHGAWIRYELVFDFTAQTITGGYYSLDSTTPIQAISVSGAGLSGPAAFVTWWGGSASSYPKYFDDIAVDDASGTPIGPVSSPVVADTSSTFTTVVASVALLASLVGGSLPVTASVSSAATITRTAQTVTAGSAALTSDTVRATTTGATVAVAGATTADTLFGRTSATLAAAVTTLDAGATVARSGQASTPVVASLTSSATLGHVADAASAFAAALSSSTSRMTRTSSSTALVATVASAATVSHSGNADTTTSVTVSFTADGLTARLGQAIASSSAVLTTSSTLNRVINAAVAFTVAIGSDASRGTTGTTGTPASVSFTTATTRGTLGGSVTGVTATTTAAGLVTRASAADAPQAVTATPVADASRATSGASSTPINATVASSALRGASAGVESGTTVSFTSQAARATTAQTTTSVTAVVKAAAQIVSITADKYTGYVPGVIKPVIGAQMWSGFITAQIYSTATTGSWLAHIPAARWKGTV